jgi:TetR/AcrR family transcriptional regulator, transcriptional repressor for nem operon
MPRNKAFETREIIEKAKLLFHSKGYEGTSMQDLVENLGISRSSLYDTFGDKQQLYLEALQYYCNENAYSLIEKSKSVSDPLAFIHEIFAGIIDDAKSDKAKKGCYVVNAISEFGRANSGVTEIIDKNNRAFEKMLEQLIVKCQENKQVAKNKDAKVMAKFLFNTICGLRVNSKTYTSIKDLELISETALSLL